MSHLLSLNVLRLIDDWKFNRFQSKFPFRATRRFHCPSSPVGFAFEIACDWNGSTPPPPQKKKKKPEEKKYAQVVLGILATSLLGLGPADAASSFTWRWLTAVSLVVPLIATLAATFVPESPYWFAMEFHAISVRVSTHPRLTSYLWYYFLKKA